MDVTVRKAEDFGQLDLSKLTPGPPGVGSWTLARGGHGLSDDVWTITVYYQNTVYPDVSSLTNESMEVWVLPDPLQAIIECVKRNAKDEAKREFGIALSKVFDLAGIDLP